MFFVFFFALLLFLMEGKRPKKKFTFQTFFVVVVCTVSSSLEADAPLRLIKIRRVLFYFFNFFFFFSFSLCLSFLSSRKAKKIRNAEIFLPCFFCFFPSLLLLFQVECVRSARRAGLVSAEDHWNERRRSPIFFPPLSRFFSVLVARLHRSLSFSNLIVIKWMQVTSCKELGLDIYEIGIIAVTAPGVYFWGP